MQADGRAEALSDVRFDRVITSGLPRTLETARIVAPGPSRSKTRSCARSRAATSAASTPDVVQEMMTAAFRGMVPLDTRFLGGESVGELLDRVLPQLDALLADESWDVVAARPPRRRQPRDPEPRRSPGSEPSSAGSSRRPGASTSSTSTPRARSSCGPSTTRLTTRRTSARRG